MQFVGKVCTGVARAHFGTVFEDMEIALHLGAHLTDNDSLVRCLRHNRQALASQGIAVPDVDAYRQQLRQLSEEFKTTPITAATQEALFDSIFEDDDVDRLVLSSENFLAMPRWAVNHSQLYPAADVRLSWLCNLFAGNEIEVFIAVQNPARFVASLIADERSGGREHVLANSDPAKLRWSDTVASLRRNAPEVPITVWAHEDTPLLWADVLQRVSGHSDEIELEGWLDWYWSIVTPQGKTAMSRYFEHYPPVSALQRKQVLGAMLDKFVRPDIFDAEPTLPDWDDDYVDALSELYEQDLDVISTMPGVTLLEP